jgi:3-dehydroquinate dehydratase-2
LENKLIKKLFILNGPNLNLLGMREPEKYGKTSLEDVKSLCNEKCIRNELDLHFFQSNFEGELIEEIHKALKNACGIIINAGALTHTSIGILDALNMFEGPKIEIHITNVYARESFRHKSFISPVATGIIAGFGVNSYVLAIDAVKELIKD